MAIVITIFNDDYSFFDESNFTYLNVTNCCFDLFSSSDVGLSLHPLRVGTVSSRLLCRPMD